MTALAEKTRLKVLPGTEADADVLRRVFEYASDGVAPYFWAQMEVSEGERDAAIRDRMARRIAAPANRFQVAMLGGEVAGGMLSYDIGAEPEDTEGTGPLVASLIRAENDLLGTHYINAIAVYPEFRRRGVAWNLIARTAAASDLPLSLIVTDVNRDARALYDVLGFHEVGRHAMEKEGWTGQGTHWVTMRQS